MSRRSKNHRGIPVYEDTVEQRRVKHVSIAEAFHFVDTQSDTYSFIDESNPERGLRVRTVSIPLRPQIGSTIPTKELLINANLSGASIERRIEVAQKLAHYNDTGITVAAFCPWPRPDYMHYNNHEPVVGARVTSKLDPIVRHRLLLQLGLYGQFATVQKSD